MPFLRRRGNMASETDIRRHATFNVPRPSNDDGDDDDYEAAPSSSSAAQPVVAGDSYSLSQPDTHQSEPPEPSPEPPTSEPERQNKRRPFSILRYRNASDSQLSLRAKQQAEAPPPVPRRTSSLSVLLTPKSQLLLTECLSTRHHYNCSYQRYRRPEKSGITYEFGRKVSPVQ